MRGFVGFTKRNLLIYFKDFQTVVFSMLTSIIVFLLYMFFIKDSYVNAVEESLDGLESFVQSGDTDMFANILLLVGVLGSALITVPFNCLSTIVKDKEQRIDYDICATPLKRWQIVLSYFTAATLSAFIMTSAILTVALIILTSKGDTYIGMQQLPMAYGLILAGSVSATAFFMIVVLFFKSTSASGSFFGILSAASGFVIGAYIPVSQFSSEIRTLCNAFPASHITILFRNVLLSGVLEHIDTGLEGRDGGEFLGGIKEFLTFRADMFGKTIDYKTTIIYITGFTILSICVMIIMYANTYKRK